LALLHSRDYQQQVETLYLAALDVSAERFAFDAQFFSGYSALGNFLGPFNSAISRITGQPGNSSSTLNASTFSNRGGTVGAGAPRWTMAKQFTTGGQLVVDFANSLLWQFSGPNNFTPSTTIDFTLIQPLLRNAGRDRVMETLTRAERALLYNVRIMEQYRQAFYVDTVVGGGTNGSTTNRIGGVGGQGLSGFSGVGATGFGNVVTSGGGGGTPPAQGAQNNSFIGLLQQQRLIRNQEDAIRRLRRNLSRQVTLLDEPTFELPTADYLTQSLQVAQARQALLQNETQLITTRNQFQTAVDQFKINELALPPQICIVPSDPLLNPFDLIDQEIIRLPEDWETALLHHPEVRREVPERIESHIEVTTAPGVAPMCRLPRYDELDADLALLRPALAEMQQFADRIVGTLLPSIQKDLEEFRRAVPRRRAYLQRLVARIHDAMQNPCDLLPLGIDPLQAASGGRISADLIPRLDASLANAEKSYQNLHDNFQRYAQELAKRGRLVDDLLASKTQNPDELFEQLIRRVFSPLYECGKTRVLTMDVVEDLTRELIELQLLQAVVRAETIEIKDVDIRAEWALDVARKYRRDWMNARATLVDRWRLLQFNADQLQAGLDIVFSGDISNIGDNPFNLRSKTGRLTAGVQFDAPLTRLLQRNQYRQSLIEYQQARRTYYFFEDTVAQNLRGQLRVLTSYQINFELNRLAVLEAARQVMLNTFIDQEAQRLATTRVTATRDVVQALTDLLNAQNQFMLIFISYEVQRLQLDFSMGTMQLDHEGLWIDPGKIGPDYGQYDPWVWRDPAAAANEIQNKAGGAAPKQDKAIDRLPPPFMLPPLEQELLPPAAGDIVPPLPGRGER
jgi:hypothetical protein